MRALFRWNCLAVCLIGTVATTPTFATYQQDIQKQNSKASAEFYRGYYLQNQQNDSAAALKAYKNALSAGANEQLRQEIDSQMASLQEDLAVADFAQLMPSDAIAYVEISRAGHHIERIAQALGIAGNTTSGKDRIVLRIDDEIQVPSDFKISPALLRELKKTRGGAVAVTGVQERGPVAVAIIHPGNSDLLSGLIETGVQLVPAQDNIGGFPTYRIDDDVWFVKTNQLIIAGTQPELMKGCIEKIKNSDTSSLADTTNFQKARQSHGDCAVFAYVDPNRAIKQLGENAGREVAMARILLDMDHMQHVTASLTASEQGLHFKSNLALDDQHNSLAYGILRTVPLSQKALGSVPTGAAATIGMGLNPKMVLAAETAAKQKLTGLDIGRELFANIEELALFILPTVASQRAKVPDFGVVIASNDANKSEALWNQLLEIPAMIDVESGNVSDANVAGVDAKVYRLPEPDAPEILVCRLNDDAMIAGTESAVKAAIEASRSGRNLASDSKAAAFNNSITPDTAKAIYAHVGRCLMLASQMERGRDAEQMRMIGQVVENLNLTIMVDEAESNLQVRTDLTSLPKFENIIRSLAKIQTQRQHVASQDTEKIVRPAKRPDNNDARKTHSQSSVSDQVSDF